MRKVFVVQEPLRMERGVPVARIPLHTLTPYGELIYLFGWAELRAADALSEENVRVYMTRLRTALADFDDDDFLVPTGNPTLIAMAAIVAAEMNGYVRMLDWKRNDACYREVLIDGTIPATLPED